MSDIVILPEKSLTNYKILASGEYGDIYEATYDNKEYAVKSFKLDNSTDLIFSVKELHFLKMLRDSPFILRLVAVIHGDAYINPDHNKKRYDNISFVYEKAAYDAYTFIIGDPDYYYLKFAMVNALLGLEYMHGHGVIHRDIKPQNMLWFRYEENRVLKLCDFGLSKMHTNQEKNSFNVMTPIYRAPEIILNIDYSYKCDVWSIGCVFFEFIAKKPFVNVDKGDNNALMKKIISVVPERISAEYLYKLSPNHKLKLPKTIFKNSKHSLASQIRLNYDRLLLFNNNSDKGTYDQFIDLLNGMLIIDQNKRLSSTEALNHPFFDIFREYINTSRSKYPPVNKNYFDQHIKIINCPERRYAMNVAKTLFNNSHLTNYSNLRYIFQAINMFDKFLCINQTKLDDVSSEIYFLSCFYLSMKYFMTFQLPQPFESLILPQFNTPEIMQMIANFEWILISEVLKFEIYTPTLYETADFFDIKLDIYKTANLLLAYTNLDETLKTTEKTIYEGSLFDLFKILMPEVKEKSPFSDKDNNPVLEENISDAKVISKNVKYVPTDITNMKNLLLGSNMVKSSNIGMQTAKPTNRKIMVPGY